MSRIITITGCKPVPRNGLEQVGWRQYENSCTYQRATDEGWHNFKIYLVWEHVAIQAHPKDNLFKEFCQLLNFPISGHALSIVRSLGGGTVSY